MIFDNAHDMFRYQFWLKEVIKVEKVEKVQRQKEKPAIKAGKVDQPSEGDAQDNTEGKKKRRL